MLRTHPLLEAEGFLQQPQPGFICCANGDQALKKGLVDLFSEEASRRNATLLKMLRTHPLLEAEGFFNNPSLGSFATQMDQA